MRTMSTCVVCGTKFPLKYLRKGVQQKCCSKACRYESAKLKKVCPTCGKTFVTNKLSRRKDYCSVACIQRSPCQLCGKIITGRAKFQGGEKRFCSRRCSNVVHRTLAGKKNYVVRGFAQTIVRLGTLACEKCGFSNPDGLTVHHIDKNRSNNRDDNLITLCGTCHALQHWSGSRNRQRDVLVAHFIARHNHNLPT